ncbi:Biorientation of chromosomes in cell division protein 1-like 1 [Nymphon striatum]|nr:Biorientation of chromosomes in cell division protein 1-like 1 [Nymphon striatum]
MDSSIKSKPPGDPALIAEIVNYIKSEGIFDELRRECLSDVDTKPAFQNLKQRVEGFSSNFLAKIKWQPDLNKNQLRDNLRTELSKSGMMKHGVDHLVDQVVNQKILKSFLPKIKEVFFNYSGLKMPEDNQPVPVPGIIKKILSLNLYIYCSKSSSVYRLSVAWFNEILEETVLIKTVSLLEPFSCGCLALLILTMWFSIIKLCIPSNIAMLKFVISLFVYCSTSRQLLQLSKELTGCDIGFPFNVPPPNVSKNMIFKSPESLQTKRSDEQPPKTEFNSPSTTSPRKKMSESDNGGKNETESTHSDSSCSSSDNVSRKQESKSNSRTVPENHADERSDSLHDKDKGDTKFSGNSSLSLKNSKTVNLSSIEDKKSAEEKNISAFDRLLKSGKPSSNSASKSSGALTEYSKDSDFSKSPDCNKNKLSSKHVLCKSEESDSEKISSTSSSKEIDDYKSSDNSDKVKKRQKLKCSINKKLRNQNIAEKSSSVIASSDSSDSESLSSSPSKMPNIENFRIFASNRKSSSKIDSHKEYSSSGSEQFDDCESKKVENNSKNKTEVLSDNVEKRTCSNSGDLLIFIFISTYQFMCDLLQQNYLGKLTFCTDSFLD